MQVCCSHAESRKCVVHMPSHASVFFACRAMQACCLHAEPRRQAEVVGTVISNILVKSCPSVHVISGLADAVVKDKEALLSLKRPPLPHSRWGTAPALGTTLFKKLPRIFGVCPPTAWLQKTMRVAVSLRTGWEERYQGKVSREHTVFSKTVRSAASGACFIFANSFLVGRAYSFSHLHLLLRVIEVSLFRNKRGNKSIIFHSFS